MVEASVIQVSKYMSTVNALIQHVAKFSAKTTYVIKIVEESADYKDRTVSIRAERDITAPGAHHQIYTLDRRLVITTIFDVDVSRIDYRA